MSAISRILSRARMREEGGWLMVEIMVGAVALIITGLAIYSGLDRASTASGQNRNRSVAAYLAQQDQERLRSLDTAVLIGYIKTPYNQTLNVAGKNYTVTSNVAWANDSNGTATSCTSTTSLATYLKISSTVTDPTAKNGPVKIDSLLSPRADQGGAAAQVVNRTGTTGVSGVAVALDEDASKNDTTDTSGCAQFGFLKGTNYHVSFNQTGYVDPDGNANITHQPITVVTGSSSVTQFMYDLAGSIKASFRDASGANNTAYARGLTVFNTGMSGTQERSYLTGTGLTDAASAVAANNGTFTTAANLFPFTSSYTVWAGSCDAAKPPVANMRSALVSPGATLTLAATTAYLLQPKLQVNVKKKATSTSTPVNLPSADVRVTDVCGALYPQLTATDANGNTSSGFPFGTLTVCADDNAGSPHFAQGTVTNVATGSSINLQINQYQTTQAGSCPQ